MCIFISNVRLSDKWTPASNICRPSRLVQSPSLSRGAIPKYTIVFLTIDRLLVLDILKSGKSRGRDRFISYSKYSKYSRRGTLFIQIQVGSALRRVNSFTIFLLYLFYCRSRSGFGRIFCSAFETVCASSLATCAYQIGEHLHLTFADHLDLYSQNSLR
jgi:hypothetical protein